MNDYSKLLEKITRPAAMFILNNCVDAGGTAHIDPPNSDVSKAELEAKLEALRDFGIVTIARGGSHNRDIDRVTITPDGRAFLEWLKQPNDLDKKPEPAGGLVDANGAPIAPDDHAAKEAETLKGLEESEAMREATGVDPVVEAHKLQQQAAEGGPKLVAIHTVTPTRETLPPADDLSNEEAAHAADHSNERPE